MKRSPFNPFFTTSCSDMIMVMMTIWMKTASVLFLTLQLIGTSVRQSIMDHLYLGYRGAPPHKVLYGEPGACGVVTMPFGVREGINVFLDGFVPTENLRFREESLKFRPNETAGDDETMPKRKHMMHSFPHMKVTLGELLSLSCGRRRWLC